MGKIYDTGWNDFQSALGTSTTGVSNCAGNAQYSPWQNPTNALAAGGGEALGPVSTQIQMYNTAFLHTYNPGVIVEQINDIIRGVEIRIYKRADNVSAIVQDCLCYMMKAGSQSGDNKTVAGSWYSASGYVTHGGPSDLWGNSLTADDVNDSGFGVIIEAYASGTPSSQAAFVDHIQVKAYYEDNRMFCAM